MDAPYGMFSTMASLVMRDDGAAPLPDLARERGDQLEVRAGVHGHVPVEGLDRRVEDPGIDGHRHAT